MSKKNIFRIILILIPIIILSLLELTLRIIGYDNDLRIVSTIERNGKNYYTMNQMVGKRYFGKERLYYRKGSHDYFEVNKQSNTVRVFCFGASTMAGFPYEYNAIPSEFLRDRLTSALPNKNIEVINTAIAATNSFTVVQFEKKLTAYKPDLFIIYMGQNEFYGVYGVGSTISIGKSRFLINTYLWFEQFKTFLLIKDAINSLTNVFKSSNSDKGKILMEEMAKNNSIGFNSEDYRIAVNTFRENYKDVIEIAKQNKIPIIISTLVTNEDDLKPFVSMYSTTLDDSLKSRWKMLYLRGTNYMKNENYKDAIDYFDRAVSIDSLPAIIHFKIGKCYEKLGNYNFARDELSQAVDLDGLRFRSPSKFNRIIKKLSANYKVPLADVQKDFQSSSEHGIIGNNLLVDHVHPNIGGYFLMAKCWFKTIKKNKLLGLTSNIVENDSLLWKASSVTYLDSTIGDLKIRELHSRPPFQKVDEPFNFVPQNFVENIAYQYVVKHQISWGNAHLEVAKEFFNRGDYANAVRELRAVLITDETNPNILKLIGDMYFNLKFYSKAESFYIKAFSLTNNYLIEYKLGLTSYAMGKYKLSIQYLNNCIVRNNYNSQTYNSNEIIDIYYHLALANAKMRSYKNALQNLQAILKIDPTNSKAISMLVKFNGFKDSLNVKVTQ